jgi:hypothetical protein
MGTLSPRHFELPTQDAWDDFADVVGQAALQFDQKLKSPDTGLTGEQFAVRRLWWAFDNLILHLDTGPEVLNLVHRISEALEHQRHGILDPLLEPKLFGPGRKTYLPTVWTRAQLLRLLGEQVDDATGLTAAAESIAEEWERATPPPEQPPFSGKTLLNWRSQTLHPVGTTDRFLLDYYLGVVGLPLPLQAGSTIGERVAWIILELRKRAENRH